MTNSPFDALRSINRKHLHQIWLKAREGKMEGLTARSSGLARSCSITLMNTSRNSSLPM